MKINYTRKDLERDLFKRNGKYAVIGGTIAFIHLVYIIYFWHISCFTMLLYNTAVVIIYSYYAYECTMNNNRVRDFYFYLLFEIPLHATLATLYLGWNYRFMTILIGILPCLFYFVLFIDSFKSKLIIPVLGSILYVVDYIVINYVSHATSPIQNVSNELSGEQFFAYFNTICAFLGCILFNVISTIEYTYVKNKITDENVTLGTYASYDSLTQLYNRRSTNAALEKIYLNNYHDSESFSVIMCDIDKFKLVNDTYGHDAGDYVLKEVAGVLKSQVRDTDVVGRWGGEEFLIIVTGNKTSAAALAERIRTQIENHKYIYKGIDIKITLTLGVSAYHSGTDIPALITSADKKLYRGKENGRNQVVA